jgi:hypothetical protein
LGILDKIPDYITQRKHLWLNLKIKGSFFMRRSKGFMMKREGTAIFIYGDGIEDSVLVTWELIAGERLTNKGSWRAEITIDLQNDEVRARRTSTNILEALRQKFIFKLKLEDGSVFTCGISSLEDFSAYGVGIYPLEICSRNLFMVRLE